MTFSIATGNSTANNKVIPKENSIWKSNIPAIIFQKYEKSNNGKYTAVKIQKGIFFSSRKSVKQEV